MMSNQKPEGCTPSLFSSICFANIRNILWPIYGAEHKKFLPLALMMTCILFNYSLLRSIKDGLINTAVGTEALGFLKTYFVLPSALLATVFYSICCQYINPKKVFYIFAGIFVGYFLLFTFVFFPHAEYYQIDQNIIASWAEAYPRLKWFFRIFEKWTFGTFYIIAELWGSMMLSLFFWQLANQVTNSSEVKRFYSMFGFVGNIGLIGTGLLISSLLGQGIEGSAAKSNFTFVLNALSVSAGFIVLLYYHVQNNIANNPALVEAQESKSGKKGKVKLSLSESFKVILTSRYLGLLATLLICYGVSTILIESVWKDRIRVLHPTIETYTVFMGNFQFYQGIVSMIFMLVGTNILRLCSWYTAAILTPLMILATSAFFFFFIFASQPDSALSTLMVVGNPLAIAVTLGSIQNILSKATKYSLFDSTQKMAYIPLSDDLKTKGMSAVEVIGGRFGKSGGGFLVSTLLMILPGYTLAQATPILAVMAGVIVVIWLAAVNMLSSDYQKALAAQEK